MGNLVLSQLNSILTTFPIKVNKQWGWGRRAYVGGWEEHSDTLLKRSDDTGFVVQKPPSLAGIQIHIKLDNNLDNLETSPRHTHASCFHAFLFLPLKHLANKHSLWIRFQLWSVIREKFWIFHCQGNVNALVTNQSQGFKSRRQWRGWGTVVRG